MASIQELEHLKIPLEHIKLATNNFSDDNFIGIGGFGSVYKGQLPLPAPATTSTTSSTKTAATVAIKRLDVKSTQGQPEFLRELVMLSSYKHENLVSLVGFCDEGGEKIIVYEHEVRGSLDKYVATELPWVQRLQICLGAARGLNYLHNGVGMGHRVLHCDIKSSNILLDENWEAKVSDFGLSKIGPTNQEFTFLVTNAAGTLGYVDPVYMTTGVLTKESDVYSFGVLLFEVLCGRLAMDGKYNDERKFLSYYEAGKLDEIIIPGIRKEIKPNSLSTFSRIAYQCLENERKRRPTMASVMEQLQISLEFQIGTRSGTRLWGSSTGGEPWSLQLDNNQKLRKITIDHEDWIYSIGFTTEDFSGSLDSSQYQQHGGHGGRSGGQISEVTFEDDEEITGIVGTVGVTTGYYRGYIIITSLCFLTNKRTHGRFGKKTGTPFYISWDVGSFVGFYGRAGYYLDGFGCYLKATV